MPEHRLTIRYPCRRSLKLRGGGGALVVAQSTEVSLRGIGLLVDREAVLALGGDGTIPPVGDPLELLLPPAEGTPGTGDVACPGRVRHLRRVAQHQYHLGLAFDALEGAPADRLRALVDGARSDMPL